ncbi:MAG: MerR family transcriptional regulator [Desulfobaccales bacterium]
MAFSFGRKAVMVIVGISKMQLEHWDRAGVVRPFKPAAGKGTRREYNFKDLVALKVAKRLRDEGISLQKIRKALAYLRRNFPEKEVHLSEFRFLTDGATVFVVDRDPQKLLDALRDGQLVISLALGELIEALKGEVKKLAGPKEEKIVVKGRTLTVLLTPDLEDGGFLVQCREIPGAISQGETEQEALDKISEVLEEHFEYVKEHQAGEVQAL